MRKVFSPWKLFGFLFGAVLSIPYLGLLIVVTLFGFGFDLLCAALDTRYLSETQVKTRKTDRLAKRFDFFLNGIVEYGKIFFSL